MEAIGRALECKIDFEGQKLSETLLHVILVAFAASNRAVDHGILVLTLIQVVAFIAGYVKQDILLTVECFVAGFLMAALVVLPPWPMYNKHPIQWLSKAD